MMTALFVGLWGCSSYRVSAETLKYRHSLEMELTFEKFSRIMRLLYEEGV